MFSYFPFRMYRRATLLAVMALLFTGHMLAKPVTPFEALRIAEARLRAASSLRSGVEGPAPKMRLLQQRSVVSGPRTVAAYFIFISEDGGFAIVSGDDLITPILAYSPTNQFDTARVAPPLRWWLDGYADAIARAVSSSDDRPHPLWVALRHGDATAASLMKDAASAGPLLKTTWNQGHPYNTDCPYDASVGSRALTGCVATALAQIMKYHRWPSRGMGENTDECRYGSLYVNFAAATYDWDAMPDEAFADAPAPELAKLLFHVGVACEMDYGVTSSGAYPEDAGAALRNFFDFDEALSLQAREGYSTQSWMAMLRARIDRGEPVAYVGNGNDGGHMWVCDGYEGDMFHMNWGWGGNGDGVYTVDDLVPTNDGGAIGRFNSQQRAIVGIVPRKTFPYWGGSIPGWPGDGNYHTGDFDGDGAGDVAFIEREGKWYIASGRDGAAHWWGYGIPGWPWDGRYFIGDFNGNGASDIAFLQREGRWYIIDGKTQESLWWGYSIPGWPGDGRYFIGDFNANGTSDIAFIQREGRWYIVDGKTQESLWWDYSIPGWPGDGRYFVGDFNGSGSSDIAFLHPEGRWYIADGKTGETLWWGYSIPGWPGDGRYFIGDFNANGASDVAYLHSEGRWYITDGRTNESIWWGFSIPGWPGNGRYFVADYDGDRASDIAYLHPNGKWYITGGRDASPRVGATQPPALGLALAMELNPDRVRSQGPFSIRFALQNNGVSSFIGDVAARFFASDGQLVRALASDGGWVSNLNPGSSTEITFIDTLRGVAPGDYYVQIFARNAGAQWVEIENAREAVQVWPAAAQSKVRLVDPISPSLPLFAPGSDLLVETRLIHDDTSRFQGAVVADLLDSTGSVVARGIGTSAVIQLWGQQDEEITLSAEVPSVLSGTYLLQLSTIDARTGSRLPIAGGMHANPIAVEVADRARPDAHEENDSPGTAADFKLSFLDSISTISISASIHSDVDRDYYRLSAPPGFECSVQATVGDPGSVTGGAKISMLVSHRTNGTWSDVSDSVTAPIVPDSSVTFLVQPLYPGTTGQYQLTVRAACLLGEDLYEPNETDGSSRQFVIPSLGKVDTTLVFDSANLHHARDVDWYRVELPSDRTYKVLWRLEDGSSRPDRYTADVSCEVGRTSEVPEMLQDTLGWYDLRSGGALFAKVARANEGSIGTYRLSATVTETGPSSVNALPDRLHGVSLAPMPSTGVVRLTFSEWTQSTVCEIFDLWGSRVEVFEILEAARSKILDLSHLPAGLYEMQFKGARPALRIPFMIVR